MLGKRRGDRPRQRTHSIYAHLANGLPVKGDKVTPSTRIGDESDSGCKSCGVHLHYAKTTARQT